MIDEGVALFIALNFWAIVFGLWWGLSERSTLFVSVVPTKRPPPEAFGCSHCDGTGYCIDMPCPEC